MRVGLIVPVLLGGCSVIVPGPDSFEYVDASTSPDAARDAQLPVADGGNDAMACGEAQENCAGRCVDLRNSLDHCGMCGRACPGDALCQSGECVDPVVQLTAAWTSTCARTAAGQVYCWGNNDTGQTGAGIDDSVVNQPVRVLLPEGAVGVATGGPVACAVTSDGNVWCWGSNAEGQLGDRGAGELSRVPLRVPGVSGARAVVVGMHHACALIDDGSVLCWGSNERGQLGDGTFEQRDGPVAVTLSPADAQELQASDGTTCARRSTGILHCWGAQAVGDGTMDDSSVPRPVALGRVSLSVGGGALHCAIADDAYCWGTSASLLRGDASGPWYRPTVIPAPPLADLVELAAFSFLTRFSTIQFGAHACALLVGGGVSCWGTNWAGELGNGTTESSDVPLSVELPLPATTVAVGTLHSCAALQDGSVSCWGANAGGQLGDGTLDDRVLPSPVATLPATE